MRVSYGDRMPHISQHDEQLFTSSLLKILDEIVFFCLGQSHSKCFDTIVHTMSRHLKHFHFVVANKKQGGKGTVTLSAWMGSDNSYQDHWTL